MQKELFFKQVISMIQDHSYFRFFLLTSFRGFVASLSHINDTISECKNSKGNSIESYFGPAS